MKQTPSRILNEPSNVMGLTGSDILGLAVLFMLAQRALYIFGLEVFALLIAVPAGIALAMIRMKYRRKIIRDSLAYFYWKYLLSGFVYVQSYCGKNKIK